MASLSLYLLARFGGTPGKLLVGIRVVQLDGTAITWKHALLRNSFDLIYTMYGIGLFLAIQHGIDYRLIGSLTATQLRDYWTQVYPSWSYWLRDLNAVYGLSEAVVMLTNERRRAIHDFIAGTVVVIKAQRKPVTRHRKRQPWDGSDGRRRPQHMPPLGWIGFVRQTTRCRQMLPKGVDHAHAG